MFDFVVLQLIPYVFNVSLCFKPSLRGKSYGLQLITEKRNNNNVFFSNDVRISLAQQVLVKGETENEEDLIALAGLYIDEEKNCKLEPLMAKQGNTVKKGVMTKYIPLIL